MGKECLDLNPSNIVDLTDDASRVKLKELNDIPGSDYINASYIDVRVDVLYQTKNYLILEFTFRDTIVRKYILPLRVSRDIKQ